MLVTSIILQIMVLSYLLNEHCSGFQASAQLGGYFSIHAPNINPNTTKTNITICMGEAYLENLLSIGGDPKDLTAL